MQTKQATSQGRSWIMAAMLSDDVRLGVYWQLKLYVFQMAPLVCPCPLVSALFFSMNGIPMLPGVQVKVLGIIIYSALSHTAHLQITSKSCWFHLPNISRMRPYLPASTTTALAKPASHWEKKPPWTSPSTTHCTVVTLVSSRNSKRHELLGLCVCSSLRLGSFLPCVLLPPVPLYRESFMDHHPKVMTLHPESPHRL